MKKNYSRYTILFSAVFYLFFANSIFASNVLFSKDFNSANSLPLKNNYLKTPLQINGIVFPITINPLVVPNLKVNQTADYVFSYLISNTKNTQVKSYVWVDFDNNGIYTSDEAILTTIPANALNFKATVNFPNASFIDKLKIGPLNIKFTTTSTTLIDDNSTPNLDERSTSLGIDGETETFTEKNISGISISGSVFIDGNSITDNVIFGTGVGIIEGTPLQAYLLDNTNAVISKSVFSLGGSFKFDNLYKGSYSIAVSLNNYAIGTTLGSIVSNLPLGWNLAAESYGSIGNLPLGIEPGLPNMQIPIITQTAPGGTDIFGVNFGINRTPVASNDEIATPINTRVDDCNLVANDNDPDGNQTIDKSSIILIDPQDGLKKTTVTLPNKGEFRVDAGGNVSFVPAMNFLGVAPVISYTVKDKAGIESNVALIKVVVKPVGVDDIQVLDAEVSSITINILNNDGISGILAVPAETFKNPDNVQGMVVNPNGEITFLFPPNQTVPNTYVYTYVLKTADGVYSDPITATIVVAYSPAITLVKTAVFNDTNNDGLAQAGETITYSFKVINTGNVDVINATVSDPKINLVNAAILPNLLKPGETGFLNIIPNIYTITPADILAGQVKNTATAKAFEPITKKNIISTSDAIVIFPILKLKLVKTSRIIDVNNNGFTDVGDKIEYTFTVTNLGTVSVINIGITDPKIGIFNEQITPSTLAPSEVGVLTSTSTYTITLADIIKGFVSNKATANGTNVQNTPVSAESENGNTTSVKDPACPTCTITEIIKEPRISLIKTSVFNDTNGDTFAQVGETITYTFKVKNTGNVTINNITINDAMLGMVNVPINPTNLAPSQEGTYTVVYVLTQANIDAGKVSNTAVAKGFDPSNNPVTDTSGTSVDNDSPTVIDIVPKPSLSLVKSSTIVDVNNNGINDAGDKINYTFKVTNTGNVTLTNITLTDVKAAVTGGPIVTLSPKAVDNTTFTATYTITQADVDKGFVYNIATAKASSPGKTDDVTATSTSGNPAKPTDIIDPTCPKCTVTPIEQKSKIALIKKVINTGTGANGTFLVGEVIRYSFTITNLGNLTINNLVLTDPLFLIPNIALPSTTLLPKASITVTGEYTVTAANISAGLITNQAVVTGLDTKNVVVEDKSGTTNDTDDKTVTSLVDGFFIPNVFTPNGDGINDTFEIVGLQNYSNVEIEVFNRWGNQVYKNLNYQNQWLAEGLNEGTYYYIIQLKTLTNNKIVKGWVLIKR
ncbi:MAG: hypothetical protein EAZ15_02690 [Sphingobacteriales bacterium]|nr:MAG: hypothetical protein EAZ15_02690 [Sphingobacteriales bacterium]